MIIGARVKRKRESVVESEEIVEEGGLHEAEE